MSLLRKKHFALWIWTAAVLLEGVSSPVLEAQPQSLPPKVLSYADLVLYNGQVLTVDDSFRIAQAVAVRDDNILAVGSSDRIRAMAGPNTRQIDLKGRSVTPGLIDTHIHFHNYAERGLIPRVIFQTRQQALRMSTIMAAYYLRWREDPGLG